jgi:hypothetical protein
MKACNTCGESKPIDQFKKHTSTKDRLSNFCKACTNARQIEYRRRTGDIHTKQYEKTINGYIMRMYRNMKSRIMGIQKAKAHLYEGKELMDRHEFYRIAIGSTALRCLFDKYHLSGFMMSAAPSVDRINPSIGYTAENIRFVTHSENSRHTSRNLKGEVL